MKKLNKYRKSVQGLMLLTFGLTMAGCSAQDDFFTETSSESLSIKPSVTEATVSRTVASDIDLREAALDNLYVKIFDKEYKEQSVNKKFDHNLQSNQKEILGQGNWKVDLKLQENKDYSVYSIANAKENLTKVNSLADLEKKVQTDEDIWKPYSSDNATKNFLMTAINSKWTVSKEPTQIIESKLTRAAAKIVVNLKINVAGYEVVGVPTWQLLNYNTQTTLFGPNTAKNIASMSETETMAKTADVYQLVTYSYATSWDDNASAPQAKIKVMLKKKGEETPVDYYYSIPVRDPKATKSLDRNYVYTAKATVTSLGSSSDITYGDAMNLVYDVQKWTKGEETTINAGEQKYLLVSPTFMIMKNQRFDNSTIKFYGSGKCTVETVKIYYYDKNGKKQSCSGSQSFKASAQYADGHGELQDQGTIVIGDANNATNDFVPLSVKYIKIKVTCEGVKDTVNVTIKQYPLEYIQGIAGWYSTKDELNTYDWRGKYTGTTVGIDWQEDRPLHAKEKGSEDAHFNAKVKEEGDYYIYEYYDNDVQGGYKATKKKSSTGDSNNRMYVVQITNTPKNSKYKIGHVTNIDKETKLSSEDVVSPAFMLASQLGTVLPFNDGVDASEHCDKYIEVRKDGTKYTEYTDWRLPTASEIGVITNYQYNKNQKVIDVVLAGGSYWALNGKQVEANPNDTNTGYVRCVRDLKPDEVKELENKNE